MDFFNELKQSLEEATAYKNGDTKKARKRTVRVIAVPAYKPSDIVRVRDQLNLSQRALANVLGVSSRTVEAWEAGRNAPNRTACHLLYLIEKDNSLLNNLAVK